MSKAKYIAGIRFENDLSPDSYLNDLPIIKYLSEAQSLAFESDVTFLVGENGTGKSTLLEAIAVAYGFNAEGGTRNFNFETKRSHSELYDHITLVKRGLAKDGFFLRAESMYNAASYIDETGSADYYGGISLHNQSHGESFLSIVQNRFGGKGIYLLDEPEAALSPMRQMTLMAEMKELINKGSQFIIATHSPILMAFPGAEILQLSEKGIERLDYKDTEHYQVTKMFLDNPEQMIGYLFSEE